MCIHPLWKLGGSTGVQCPRPQGRPTRGPSVGSGAPPPGVGAQVLLFPGQGDPAWRTCAVVSSPGGSRLDLCTCWLLACPSGSPMGAHRQRICTKPRCLTGWLMDPELRSWFQASFLALLRLLPVCPWHSAASFLHSTSPALLPRRLETSRISFTCKYTRLTFRPSYMRRGWGAIQAPACCRGLVLGMALVAGCGTSNTDLNVSLMPASATLRDLRSAG